MRSFKESLYQFMIGSWWVIVFMAFTYVFYNQSINRKELELLELNCRLNLLQDEKVEVMNKNKDLQDRIAAQKDPAFIEMLLMEELGVVPDGFLKVHFRKKES